MYQFLLSQSAINTLIGNRAFVGAAPINTQRPYIVYYMPNTQPTNDTPSQAVTAMWRIEARSDNYKQAEDLSGAIYNVCNQGVLSVTGWTSFWMSCDGLQQFSDDLEGRTIHRFSWDVMVELSKD